LYQRIQGIRSGQSGKGFETFAAKRKGKGSQTTAFGIGEADALMTQFSVKGVVFFQESLCRILFASD